MPNVGQCLPFPPKLAKLAISANATMKIHPNLSKFAKFAKCGQDASHFIKVRRDNLFKNDYRYPLYKAQSNREDAKNARTSAWLGYFTGRGGTEAFSRPGLKRTAHLATNVAPQNSAGRFVHLVWDTGIFRAGIPVFRIPFSHTGISHPCQC